MKTIVSVLGQFPQISDYKILKTEKRSSELFFVHGVLETQRTTCTTDREVTVYVAKDGCMGDARFPVYSSTTPQELTALVQGAAERAALIHNPPYSLPQGEQGEFSTPSNFSGESLSALAVRIANAVLGAKVPDNGSINALEVFVNQYTQQVVNSRGLDKTQIFYTAMAEVIPTFNGERQSVELYEQENFNSLDAAALQKTVEEKLREVSARYSAEKPAEPLTCPVVFHTQELMELCGELCSNCRYQAVYNHANLYSKGDAVQTEPKGDTITLTMAGAVEGCSRSLCFDEDGITLHQKPIIEQGVVTGYFGDNRFGQYLGETPTGNLGCYVLSPGTLQELPDTYLEILSMSGLQADGYTDYLGGEIRLAYYHHNGEVTPLTGISVSGKLSQALNHIRFSAKTATCSAYAGPDSALVEGLSIF